MQIIFNTHHHRTSLVTSHSYGVKCVTIILQKNVACIELTIKFSHFSAANVFHSPTNYPTTFNSAFQPIVLSASVYTVKRRQTTNLTFAPTTKASEETRLRLFCRDTEFFIFVSPDKSPGILWRLKNNKNATTLQVSQLDRYKNHLIILNPLI